ncbi:GNAT family N-acetyltransferase, partial [Euryarchaeota archaeon]|nr:GNAT family N-acetyltransferase [Euryarchaeota archaeon]
PPQEKPFRITTYFSKETLEQTVYAECEHRLNTTFEVRALTVNPAFRGQNISFRLMRYALEFILERDGTDIVAMGHSEVAELYRKNGMTVFDEHGVLHGQTLYYPMYLSPIKVMKEHALRIDADINLEDGDDVCYHGGKSWDTSKFDFEIRDSLVVADVLDSPFPPCPEALDVLREQLERCCQESPPTQCEELKWTRGFSLPTAQVWPLMRCLLRWISCSAMLGKPVRNRALASLQADVCSLSPWKNQCALATMERVGKTQPTLHKLRSPATRMDGSTR